LNPELLLRALRAGIKEVLSQPIAEDEVRKAVYNYIKSRRGTHNLQKINNGSVIILLGAKGESGPPHCRESGGRDKKDSSDA